MRAKLIFVNRFFYPDHSATSQLLSDLAFELAGGGHRVWVITGRQLYQNPEANLAATANIDGVWVQRIWTTRFGRGSLIGRAIDYATFYLSAAVRLALWVRHGDVVIAKTDPPLISVIAWPVCRLRGAALVNWLQDLFPEVAVALGVGRKIGPLLAILQWLRNLSLKAAKRNVVLGERMRARLLLAGVRAERIRIIHNWADGDAVKPVPRNKNELRKEWELRDQFVVGYSGNLGRAHEFKAILSAAEILKWRQEIVFLFIGAGAQLEAVDAQATRAGLVNIQFKPYQPRERLANSLSVPDVHLISLNPELEGLIVPSKFYGVAAAGRPTLFVGANDGEIATLIESGDCGFVVAPGDGDSLAARISHLANNLPECERLGRNARNLFDLNFDRGRAAKRWVDVVNEVVDEFAGGRSC